jgi:hypothetical protein
VSPSRDAINQYTPLSKDETSIKEEEAIGLLEYNESRNSTESEEATFTVEHSKFSHLRNPYVWLNSVSELHKMSFNHLLPVFLNYPRTTSSYTSLLQFASRFRVNSSFTGTILTIAKLFGITTAMLIFPNAARKFDTRSILRLMIFLFPLFYFAFPFTLLPLRPGWRTLILILALLMQTILPISAVQSCLILLTPTRCQQNKLQRSKESISQSLVSVVALAV